MNGITRLLLTGGFGLAIASADTIGIVGGIASKTLVHGLSRTLAAAPAPIHVPEPASFAVLGLGLALAIGMRRKKTS